MKQADLTEPITRAQNNDRTRRRWIFAAGGLVGLCLILVFCSAGGFLAFRWFGHPGGSTSTTTAAAVPIPSEFSSLGSLASVPSNPQSFNVDKNAHLLKLGSGMSLQVPAGAFSSPNQLLLTQVNVAFDKISFEVKQSPFYVLSPRDEVGTLGSPLILEIPIPSGDVMVVQYDGQNWQAVAGASGQTVQLKITHFSNWIWGYFESRSEEDLKENLSQNPALNIPTARQRTRIENGDALTRAFFGVGEAAEQSQDQMCSEIMDVLTQYNTPKNREFPSDSTTLNLDLAPFLFAGSAPKSSGGYYYDITKTSLDTINSKVLASTTLLSPADVLKISIDANGGNIPLGVLAAHNYLKQIKYQGIHDYHVAQPFPPDQGLPASHLASWREDSNITPAGEYDKMGPLYHIFAAMTAGVWFPTRLGGDIAVNGEAMLRSFQLLKDNPDMQKAAADACGDNAAVWLRDNPPTETTQPAQPQTTTGGFIPFSAADCQVPGLTSVSIENDLVSDASITCFFEDAVNGVGRTFTLDYFPNPEDAQSSFNSNRADILANMWSGTTTTIDDPDKFSTLYFYPGDSPVAPYYHIEETEVYKDNFSIYISCQLNTTSQQEEETAAQDLLTIAEGIADQHYR
jgi:hypothetical protein